MFDDKIIVVTGGTGSFGKQVLRRFLETGVGEVRVFSRDEKKQEDMRLRLAHPRLRFFIGDVRDRDSLRTVMRGAHLVFHAAALKQVPSCEFYPLEALRTNVLGTENVLTAALEAGVERVIALSTDKAVYPINAMGQTKALMEKVLVAKARTLRAGDTILCATRYGNVMGSRGSVIPLFVSQIKEGRPLTVTDPTMTRFLMSLDESVDLVVHTFRHGTQGDLFVQKAPATTVETLAQALLEIFEADNPIRIVGTRHGEKVFETLVSREEMARAETLDRYFRIPPDNREFNYAVYQTTGERRITEHEDYTSHNTERLDVAATKQLLLGLDFIRRNLAGNGVADLD